LSTFSLRANEAEFAIIIGDLWQRHGLGTELLKLLVQIGRDEKLDRISATILSDNRGMQAVARKVGFELSREAGTAEVLAEIRL